jgi:AAHS family 4-hydroxybenzoate transporter-like MFS transporter
LLPATLAVLLLFCLPESPRYLATRGDQGPELARLLNRVTATTHYRGNERWYFADVSGGKLALRALFSPTYRHNTLIIWLIFFSNLLAVYSFFNWIPTLLTGAGLTLNDALRGALLFNLGGVLGALAGAIAMNRVGSKPVMVTLASLGVSSCLLLSYLSMIASLGLMPLYLLIFVAGACINGQQVQMFTVTGHAYPTRIRAMGVGAGLASARVGSIASAFAGSVLANVDGNLAVFFAGLAAVLLFTLLGVLWLRCHLPPTGGLLSYRGADPSGA